MPGGILGSIHKALLSSMDSGSDSNSLAGSCGFAKASGVFDLSIGFLSSACAGLAAVEANSSIANAEATSFNGVFIDHSFSSDDLLKLKLSPQSRVVLAYLASVGTLVNISTD